MRLGRRPSLLGVVVVVGLCLQLSGCMTVIDLRSTGKPKIFGGTRGDLALIVEDLGKLQGLKPFLVPFAILDLPLSLCADVVLLPLALLVELQEQRMQPEDPEEPEEE